MHKSLFSGALKKLMYKGQNNNEIEELIYIGKSKHLDAKNKHFRQFLVRRQRSLEVMFTNGLYQWSERVPGSECKHPFGVSDIILSQNSAHLLAYYSPQNNLS